MKKSILVLFAILVFTGSLFARENVYVVSPTAKFMDSAKLNAAGPSLAKGTKLDVLAKEGMFYKVSLNGKTGYVAKMFTSATPPAKEKASVASTDEGQSPSARRRASGFSETASARGLTSTEEARIHGSAKDYDYPSIKWLDEQSDKVKSGDTDVFTKTIQ